MEKPSSYCEYVNTLEKENLHKIYHDSQYGFPILSDNELFGRLILEINQAGKNYRMAKTKLIINSKDIVPLNYLLDQTNNSWKIFDVLIDGSISEIATKKSEFINFL